MEGTPKISVVVPVYNAEKWIERCLKSIYAQTFDDYEIILVNDGSTDNSAEICRKFRDKDSRITFIDKKNEGAGSARNAGLEAARGEYLAFPDVDDWFEPQMYAELYETASSGNYDIVFSGANFYARVSADSEELLYSRTANCEAVRYNSREECRKNVMTFFPTSTIFDVPWNKLYKRSVAVENNVRFSDTRRCQDAMFNIAFYDAVSSAASVDKAYYNYIENTSASVNRKFPKNYIDINIMYYSMLISILKSWGMYGGDIKKHYDTSVVISVYETLGMLENPVWNLSKAQQREYVESILNRDDVHALLKDNDVREDAREMDRILKQRDYRAFMKNYRKEKLKDVVRKNKLVMKLYHKAKG